MDLAARGMEVALLEKSPFLGGWVAKWDRVYPTDEKASDIISELAGKVLNHPSITVYNCSLVDGVEGYIGNFKLHVKRESPGLGAYDSEIKKMSEAGKGLGEFIPFVGVCPSSIPEAGEEHTIETGVIILATGFKPYTPRRGEYGYGNHAEVITLKELIPVIAENRENSGNRALEVNGRKIKNMAMIHCVGSRQIPGVHEADSAGNLNQYCSRTCCSATLHAGNTIREAYPETRVFDFYRDIRTYGRGHEELYEKASRNKVVFFRFEADEPPVISKNKGTGNYPLSVQVKDVLTFDEEIEVPVDLVVLATGMEPNDVSDLVRMMKLPVGVDRFLLEVHPKLRPVEMAVSGILLAGTAQAPFDIGEACAAASAASVKASAILGRGYVELDPFVAEVDPNKCTGCGACLEACVQEGVLSLVETEVNGVSGLRAQVNPALCTGGGTCVGVCPENAIDINGWTLKQYQDMVDMIVSDQIL